MLLCSNCNYLACKVCCGVIIPQSLFLTFRRGFSVSLVICHMSITNTVCITQFLHSFYIDELRILLLVCWYSQFNTVRLYQASVSRSNCASRSPSCNNSGSCDFLNMSSSKSQLLHKLTITQCRDWTDWVHRGGAMSTNTWVMVWPRDCQGFQNPQGSGVGYMRVRVGVGILYPHETLTPG